MFGILEDVAKGVGSVIGTVTGSVLGLSVSVISGALGITQSMAKEALDSGCKTYEEIKDFHKL